MLEARQMQGTIGHGADGNPIFHRQPRAGGLGPDPERLDAGCSMVGSRAVVAAEVEEVGDRIVNGQEALDVGGFFEALPLPLAPPGGSVGGPGPIVRPLGLAVLPAHPQLPLGHSVGAAT
ncbi:hypothetical protein GCM10022293_48780 [Azospirillum formosense]